ncbi:hypothetical protein [Aureivirga sp. CE67]|uniref:hypothetical protein n=1 Tax=Aureivirga sp. CE67 TaxID=1788983 RepID=UPI001E28FBA4|nr:hypothetical protein [Aureivirga sp. CE67]
MKKILWICKISLIAIAIFSFINCVKPEKSNILFYEVNLKSQDLRMFWKNEKGQNYKNFENLMR